MSRSYITEHFSPRSKEFEFDPSDVVSCLLRDLQSAKEKNVADIQELTQRHAVHREQLGDYYEKQVGRDSFR